GIIAMIASTILFPLKIWSRFGRLRHLLVIALIWIYAFTCGMAPSLVRAAILITIFLLAKVLQRQSSPYNSLCVAAIAILAFSPRQLFSPGFQLSFCAVLSILAFNRAFNPIKDQRSRLYKLALFVTVPVSAMLGTCLVSMFHFHRFPLLFLIPNLLLAVLLPLLLALGVILVLSTAIGIKLTIIGIFADSIYNSISKLCEVLATFPNAEVTGIFLSPATIILSTISILLLAVACHSRRKILFISLAACMSVALLIHLEQPPLPKSELYITRQPLRTDIVLRDCDTALIFTTAHSKDHQAIAARLSSRYANYLSRRNCRSQLTATDSDFTLPSIRLRNNYLIFNDKTLLIPTASLENVNPSITVNYIVISRAAGNRPFDYVKAVGADTVIITRDMPSIRAQRLMDSCKTYSIPYVHLTNHPFFLTSTN
ncbi:MAG: ComEC/Rec2 family competence protein, partial [Muribaculaceae bacterium]|nr:ComEC/Rec2 family competence protein [Muribaculaceae bacterium]